MTRARLLLITLSNKDAAIALQKLVAAINDALKTSGLLIEDRLRPFGGFLCFRHSLSKAINSHAFLPNRSGAPSKTSAIAACKGLFDCFRSMASSAAENESLSRIPAHANHPAARQSTRFANIGSVLTGPTFRVAIPMCESWALQLPRLGEVPNDRDANSHPAPPHRLSRVKRPHSREICRGKAGRSRPCERSVRVHRAPRCGRPGPLWPVSGPPGGRQDRENVTASLNPFHVVLVWPRLFAHTACCNQ